ncbi:septal ring lytic transglycosylase RlpA family protein [Synechococcus sp. NOUM97013]|uniref:septal ring lytic transglycosylase RlpA family protein n=1 Tax=Synechococcus sp. NOUM97013 TaxID=1442555 RepID=UPI0016462624|nr:septal ring lytic transglycosylase RlpA family protein [Synechococcus sp. NOUM97013]QNI74304.1 rare lipoA family protein [Synechococcus sp. NOUM97013]
MTLPHRLATFSCAFLIMGAVGCSSEQATSSPEASADALAVQEQQPEQTQAQSSKTVEGRASWYGPGFYGRKTTSGEVLKKGTMTAAHSSLPMGTEVKVTRTDTGKSVTVVINDRKPFKPGTVIDLAHGSAVALDIDDDGTGPVQIEVIKQP